MQIQEILALIEKLDAKLAVLLCQHNADTDATIASATGVSNSVDNEPIRFIRREDDTNTGQGMDASWDWIRVREYASTEPSVAFGVEEFPTNAPFSVSAWVYADTLGATDRVITARNNSGGYDWAIYNDSANPGKLAFTSDGETNTGLSDTTLSTSSWYLVTMSVDMNDKTKLT